jgi:hypothetical protein
VRGAEIGDADGAAERSDLQHKLVHAFGRVGDAVGSAVDRDRVVLAVQHQ